MQRSIVETYDSFLVKTWMTSLLFFSLALETQPLLPTYTQTSLKSLSEALLAQYNFASSVRPTYVTSDTLKESATARGLRPILYV